jgi:hypothetical protein
MKICELQYSKVKEATNSTFKCFYEHWYGLMQPYHIYVPCVAAFARSHTSTFMKGVYNNYIRDMKNNTNKCNNIAKPSHNRGDRPWCRNHLHHHSHTSISIFIPHHSHSPILLIFMSSRLVVL